MSYLIMINSEYRIISFAVCAVHNGDAPIVQSTKILRVGFCGSTYEVVFVRKGVVNKFMWTRAKVNLG